MAFYIHRITMFQRPDEMPPPRQSLKTGVNLYIYIYIYLFIYTHTCTHTHEHTLNFHTNYRITDDNYADDDGFTDVNNNNNNGNTDILKDTG